MVSGCRVLLLLGKSNKTITEEQTPIRKRAAFATLQMKSNSRITFHQFPIAKIQQTFYLQARKRYFSTKPLISSTKPLLLSTKSCFILSLYLYIYMYRSGTPRNPRFSIRNPCFSPFSLHFLQLSGNQTTKPRNLTYKKSGSFFEKSATLFGKSAVLFGKSADFLELLLQSRNCKVFFLTFRRVHERLEFNTRAKNNALSANSVRRYLGCGVYRFDLKSWSENS